MRILQIIQKRQLRGAEIFACQLSTELIKNGDIVDVVFLFGNSRSTLDFDLNFIALNGNQKRRLWDINGFLKLANIIKRGRYDIVQANAADTLKYAVLSKLFFRWRSKIIFRNASIMSAFITGKFQLMFNRWLLGKCNYFISVSEYSRRDLMKIYPLVEPASVTISIGTYTFDAVAPMVRSIRAEDPVFIAVSSFVPEKNHTFLLDIFHLYYQQHGKGQLWLVGDGKLRSQLEGKIFKYGIQDRVKIWGYTSDVISILKTADVLVMPSLIEGLPGVILEAISCGVPVVASGVGGIPEIIINDVTGICINEFSAQLYVDKLTLLLNDTDYRNKLVKQAKIKLQEEFTIEKISAQFIAHYRICCRHDRI